MARRLLERRTLVVVLSLLLLASGTPQVLARDAAQDALLTQMLDTRQPQPADEPSQSIGTPPDDEPFRAMTLPAASGANSPYPANHTFDAAPELVGTPPANHAFETPGFSTGSPPANHDLQLPAQDVGSPPTNHDFATGDLTGWTTSGTVSIQTDAEHGSYARLDTGSAKLTTAAFTVDASAQSVVFDGGHLSGTGAAAIYVYALTGPTYATSVYLTFFNCQNCTSWASYAIDASAYRGQSIKLQFIRTSGTIAIDRVRQQVLFPDLTLAGDVQRVTEADGNVYAKLSGGGSLTTSPFVVTSDTQFVTVKAIGQTTGNDNYSVYVLSGVDFLTATQVLVKSNAPDQWKQEQFNASAWRGQTIKLRVERQYNAIGIDEIGQPEVVVPGWEVAGDAQVTAGGPSGNAVSTSDDLTSSAFTLAADIQQLTLQYAGDTSYTADSIFYLKLLRGADFSEVVPLASHVLATRGQWQTLTVAVPQYAGETVKLRLEHYWGRPAFDTVGLGWVAVPGWTATTTDAVATGDDAHGSYVTPVTPTGALFLRSSTIATGILDRPNLVDVRYYAVSYDIGYSTSNLMQVYWINTAGQQWTVHQDAASSPTGYQTRYFPLHDSKGADGHFIVKLAGGGKVYSIADNISRQHLNEPFSNKVGVRIDTSTGSFGYEVQDLAAEGTLPLVFTRYYAGHADHYGTLGYRWSHSYDTRLELTDDGDAGVIFGSGREVFFDGQAGLFTPADARVHDTLVTNGDGTYTFTTTANLAYQFTAAGVLTSITDLNGNATTLSYDTNGRLTSVADPVGRTLTLAYDTNGRLATVTDPVGAVVTYGYDANGDLTTVTDPDLGVWTYAYDKHRLVSVTDPNNHILFTNTFDSLHRVIAQTDAESNPLTIDYDTPAKGVTSVTDREGKTARFYFDRYGRTTDLVDPLGRTISRLFDTSGNLERIIDPAFNEWQFGYNSSGDLTGAIDPLGNPISITYNATHLPTTVTDGRGFVTTYAYDANGNVTSVTNALNETTTYTYDAAGRLLTITNPLNETATYTYDAQGNRISMTNAIGNTWQATYDAAGRLLTITDPRNFTTSYEYDPLGRITLIRDPLGGETRRVFDFWGYLLLYQDPLGRQTSWTYDEKGRVVSKKDPEQHSTTYAWDDNDKLISVTDALGHATTYAYDANGRLTSVTDASGGVTSYAYDLAGRLASETDPLGRSATYAYDAAGLLTSQTLSNGGVLTYTYDDNRNLLTETNPLNQTTSYTYDALNRLAAATDPDGHSSSFVYDAAGRLIEEHDALNQVTTRAYEAAGRLISITDPLNAVTTFGYDAAGNQTSITDPLGHTSTSAYDALNRVTSTTNALAQTTTFVYDAAGQRTSVTAPSGATTTSVYDANGLLTSITDPLNNVVQYAYDDIGRRISTTDQRGYTTTYAYDALTRETTVTDPLNGQLRFGYDAAGQLTSFTNARGKTTSYTYTNLSQVASVTDPLNRVTAYGYDTLGRLTSVTDPRGLTTGYSYDVGGNLTSESYASGTITYGYDALHRRTSMTDATGVTSWGYDAASRVTAVTSAAGTVGYGYDAASRRTSMTYPGNRTVSYGYDDANRLTSLTDWQSQTFTFAYNVDGLRTGITRPNGISTTYGYDAANRLTSVVHGGGGLGSNLSFSYTLDAAGNRTAVTGSRGTETYAIDPLNRITSATYPNGDTVAYTYDANGNRLTDTLNGQTIHTYTYDDADQLTSDGSRTFTYDAAGNALTAGSDAFSWDWRNRLVSATVGGTTASYAYDGDDVRVSQTANGTTTTSLWDRASGLPLLLDDGSQSYIHAGGVQSLTAPSGANLHPLADGLGSIRATTDSTGAATTTADYGVFGDVRGTTGSPGSFGFTGEQTDATTDLTYLRARYYDAEIGRFLSADTVQPNAPGASGYNRYAYVANNPTTWTDPSGHSTTEQAGLNDNAWRMARGLAALAVFIMVVFQFIADCLDQVIQLCQRVDFELPSLSPPRVAPLLGGIAGAAATATEELKKIPDILDPRPGSGPDREPNRPPDRRRWQIPGIPPSWWPFPPPWEWFDTSPDTSPEPNPPADAAPTPGAQPGPSPVPVPGPSPQPTHPPGGTVPPTQPTPNPYDCMTLSNMHAYLVSAEMNQGGGRQNDFTVGRANATVSNAFGGLWLQLGGGVNTGISPFTTRDGGSGWVSNDKLRMYRINLAKPSLNGRGGANIERRYNGGGSPTWWLDTWRSDNGHIYIDPRCPTV